MDVRVVSVASVLVALLLVGLVWYPATFSGLTSTSYQYEHRVDPVGSDAYENRLQEMDDDSSSDADELRTVRYEALSPAAQRLFDRTLETEPRYHGGHEYEPQLCQPGVVACPYPSRSELPEELHYDEDRPAADAALVVETDDGRYLFSSYAAAPDIQDAGGWPWVETLVRGLILLPFAASLAWLSSGRVRESRALSLAAVASAAGVVGLVAGVPGSLAVLAAGIAALPIALLRSSPDRRVQAAAVVLGVVLALVAVAPAYLEAYLGVERPAELQLLAGLCLSWGGVLALAVAAWRLGDESSEASAAARVRR